MNDIVNLNCWGVAIELIPLPEGNWTWTLQAEDGTKVNNWAKPFDSMEAAFAAVREFCYPLMSKAVDPAEASRPSQRMHRFDPAVWDQLTKNSI